MLIDTHIHLYAAQFDDDRAHLVSRAEAEGVKKFLMPNIDRATTGAMMDLVLQYPEVCYPMFGLHPCDVKPGFLKELNLIRKELEINRDRTVAIGETGIDLHWDTAFEQEQVEAFNIQLNWCIDYDLPVVIHSRKSVDVILSILEKRRSDGLRGVFHCFSGDREQIRRITALDFYFGIGGVLTFKNGGLDKVMDHIPRERVILETDAPYLAPAPHRGKRNIPEYLLLVADKLGEIWGDGPERVASVTGENAVRLFNLK
jgi:TatD DNase family protein